LETLLGDATDVVLTPRRDVFASLKHCAWLESQPLRCSSHGVCHPLFCPHVTQALPHFPVMLLRGQDRYGHFELQNDPPDEDSEQSIAAFREYSRRLNVRRQASERKG